MTIVSLSLPDSMIKSMDEIQKSRGFSGRSELVRTAIRLLLQDTQEKDSLKGTISAILIATHDQEDEEAVTKLKHAFKDIVRTHLHSNITDNNCVELFFLDGEGTKIASMTKGFQNEDSMKSVKLLTV